MSELDCKNAEKQELGVLLQKLINSQNQEEYDKLHKELEKFNTGFLQYFNKNWHSCQNFWVMHFRKKLRTHGNNTNNKIESHNQKLKKYVSKTMRLPEAIENLSSFIDETYAKSSFNRYANLKTKIDQRNTDGELIKFSLMCNPKAFQIVNDELRILESVKFEIIEESDETYSVIYKIKDSTFNVSVAKSMNDCTCLCFSNFGLPCRHIFACRKKYIGTIFDENLIPNRWRKEFEKQDDLEELSTVLTSTSVNKRISSKPKTVIEKFNTAYGICRDIATFLSSCGEKEFQEKIEILKNLKNEWQCSQFTTNVTHDQTKNVSNLDSIPCASENALSGFTLENVMLKNSKRTEKIPIRDTSKVVEHDVVAQNDTVVENTDDIETLDSDKELNNKDITDFMDNIKLETVQCRRGRPKGTKKPFWNFSKSNSAPGKKRKASDKIEQSNKKQKQHSEHASNNEKNNIWLITNKYTLTLTDKADIEGKELLNDKVIDAAQAIMKDQFTDPKINGLQPTLYKQNVKHVKKVDKDMVQILHRGSSGSGHWLTASTLGCPEGRSTYMTVFTLI